MAASRTSRFHRDDLTKPGQLDGNGRQSLMSPKRERPALQRSEKGGASAV